MKRNNKGVEGLSDREPMQKAAGLRSKQTRGTPALQAAKTDTATKRENPTNVVLNLVSIGKSPITEIKKRTEGQNADRDHNPNVTTTQKLLCNITKSHNPELAEHIMGQMSGAMVAHTFRSEEERVVCACAAMMGLQSGNLAESLLAVQMTGVHFAALQCLRDAFLKDQTFEGRDANVNRATRLMRLFNEQLEAMAKLKGKAGQQKVTVEHVHVNAGGQAIVGAVEAGKRNQGGGGGNTGNET